jgi:septal ring factor EnvC (AmiA/AmiB activator)
MSLRNLTTAKAFCFCLLLVLAIGASAQTNKSRKQLEKEKRNSLYKITKTDKILKQTQEKKNLSLGRLNVVKNQIAQQERVIGTINTELSFLERDILDATLAIARLENDLSRLKEEYAEMVRTASRFNNTYDQLVLILSAENLTQMIARVNYFKQYSRHREEMFTTIKAKKAALEITKAELELNRLDKAGLLDQKSQEAQNLVVIQKQHDSQVRELSQKEKQLAAELEESKRSLERLNKLIQDMIVEEQRKAAELARKEAEKAKKTTTNTKTTTINKTPAATALTGSFEANRGKLPWPVTQGTVSQRFGRQPHPVLKGVYVDNLGVDIMTVAGQAVHPVFKGKVVTVTEVPGMNYVVMVQHGSYYTVYAKIKTVNVTVGQEVDLKTQLGTVYTDKNNQTELQFMIWKGEEKLNPEGWLKLR